MILVFAEGVGRAAEAGLDKFRWKHRVVVHYRADKKQLELNPQQEAAFKDRDMVFVEADERLRRRFGLKGEKAVFILIGKDGGEKARQRGKLELKKFFALIDTMPMRRREMRADE